MLLNKKATTWVKGMEEKRKNKLGLEQRRSIFFRILNFLKTIPNKYNYDENKDQLALSIIRAKYFLKDNNNNLLETHPEDLYRRVAAFVAAIDNEFDKEKIALDFFEIMREGYFMPGGRVLAGAGDVKLKTLANCFVSIIEDDSIESIYKAAYEAARTYSYGGGIGIDISVLRPAGAIVHNASNSSTGAVSFMQLYSLTTGLIGQEGRRGALMLTIHVKHPDIIKFILSKTAPNYDVINATNLIKNDLNLSDKQAEIVQKRIIENFQVRYANISIKFTDEFFKALEEALNYRGKIIIYKVKNYHIPVYKQDYNNIHYSYNIPSKPIENYEFIGALEEHELKDYFNKLGVEVDLNKLNDEFSRDIYGDFIIQVNKELYAIRRAGDFMTIFASEEVGEIRKLYNAMDIWSLFVIGNYNFAEPGLIFWSHMTKYSNSDYIGRKIIGTNPCSEVPLEDGGACNLGSINLVRFVKKPFTDEAYIDYELLDKVIKTVVRFMDNVVEWNILLHPLEKQREATRLTRRVGIGVMGLADMLMAMKLKYDEDKAIELIEKVMKFIANKAYYYSAQLAKERGPFEAYSPKLLESPFIKEAIDPKIINEIEEYGLRNVALLSIAPTGSISNIVISFTKDKEVYTGVSGGIEPVFSLYYTRYSENLKKTFYVFHSTVRYWLDINNINIDNPEDIKIPDYLNKTAHNIDWIKRVEIQGVIQKYVDHSISSTINLPEEVHPETISELYIEAWRRKLKGITIYREGSRFAILNSNTKISNELKEFKSKIFEVQAYNPLTGKIETRKVHGLEVYLTTDGRLTTVWHENKRKFNFNKNKDVSISEETYSKCPICGEYSLVVDNGCYICKNCGYGKCE